VAAKADRTLLLTLLAGAPDSSALRS
jgi:hypothetical protein